MMIPTSPIFHDNNEYNKYLSEIGNFEDFYINKYVILYSQNNINLISNHTYKNVATKCYIDSMKKYFHI